LAENLGLHPDIHTIDDHNDAFDGLWVGDDDMPEITETHAVTRRSLPHGPPGGGNAQYMDFPDVDEFLARVYDQWNPFLVITTRSPEANIESWRKSRASSAGLHSKAWRQYQNAYPYLMDVVDSNQIEFLFASLEGLIHEGLPYLKSLWKIMGIEPVDVEVDLWPDVNRKYYS
jgi:hypothetical protein